MKAGRELDLFIALNLMGWTRRAEDGIVVPPRYARTPPPRTAVLEAIGDCFVVMPAGIVEGPVLRWVVPSYSKSMRCAWEVVEKLGLPTSLWGDGRGWVVELDSFFDEGIHVHAEAETAPHAICLAALEVLELRRGS